MRYTRYLVWPGHSRMRAVDPTRIRSILNPKAATDPASLVKADAKALAAVYYQAHVPARHQWYNKAKTKGSIENGPENYTSQRPVQQW